MDRRTIIEERAAALSAFSAQELPEASPQLVERADTIAAGHIYFYSITPVEIGTSGIDWSGKQIHHQEWCAQLNRFFCLVPLASAYRKTSDEKYARAARGYIEDWMDYNAQYLARDELHPGDNTLNMSIRLGTSVQAGWGGTLPAFLNSPVFDDEFLERMLTSISEQADFLARHLSARGNWRIAHLDALAFTALRFPFLDNANELLAKGIKCMRNALHTQFLPDGVHVERTPGYAAWMTRVAAGYVHLAGAFPEADAAVDRATLLQALDYMVQNRLFGVNDFTAPHRDPEANGLEGRAQLLELAGMGEHVEKTPPLRQSFQDAGQVFMRSSWEPGADYLAFDAGTWGGAHSHLSRLSFTFRSGGRMLIADPGILNYEMSDPKASYGKSTRAHSTISLDGMNQVNSDASLHRVEFSEHLSLIHASYQGSYWPGRYEWRFVKGRGQGIYGRHERVLLWVMGEYILCLDLMEEAEGRQIHNCWQMGPMDVWEMEPESLSWWSGNDDVNLLLRLLGPAESVEMDCVAGSEEPLRGWVGWHGNDAVPAPHVEFRYEPESPCAVSAVLACAFRGNKPPRYEVARFGHAHWGHIHHLALARPDGGTDLVSWSNLLEPPVDDGKPFMTDAPLVWLRLDGNQRPTKCFLLDGTYLEYESDLLRDGREKRACSFDL